MRAVLLFLILSFPFLAQTGQPKIKEISKNLELTGFSKENGFILQNQDRFVSEVSGSAIISPEVAVPDFTNAPFIATGIKVSGKFKTPEVISFILTVDGVDYKMHANEDGDPIISKTTILTPLYFAKPSSKMVKVTVIAEAAGVEITGVELVFINPGISNPAEPEVSVTQDTYPKPPVVSRTAWGCPIGQNSNCGASSTNVTHLIIHHTDDNNNITDWAAAVRAIYQYHTASNGWCDIGYNYLVAPTGVIYEGRGGGDNVVGAHFCGYNGGTMGVSMLGTYTTVSPSAALQASLTKLLAWKADQRTINPLGISFHASSGLTINNISGHRAACATDCPGQKFVDNDIQNIRQGVLSLIQSIAPKITSSFPLNGSNDFKVFNPLRLTFNLQMDTNTVRNAISVSPADTFAVSFPSAFEAVVTPKGLWSYNTAYTLKVDTTAKNIYGTSIDGDGNGTAGDPFFLNFTTSMPDNDPPQIVKYYPSGSDVGTFAEMMIVFNEEIANYAQNISLSDGVNNNIPLSAMSFNWDGKYGRLAFKTVTALTGGKFYLLKLKSNISDRVGNRLPQDFDINFHVPIVNYADGNIVDRFEGYSTWGNPLQTPGTTGVDTTLTNFSITSEKKKGGIFAGKLGYKFTGTENGKIVLKKSTGHLLPTGNSTVGIWIFGELNNCKLSMILENSSEVLVDMGRINFYGWRFFNIPFDNSAGNTQFKGFVLQQTDIADNQGSVYFDNLQFNGTFTGIEDEGGTPEHFTLQQNYPNPFNPETVISFTLPQKGFVTGKVYDVMGREIAVLLNGEFESGFHSVRFNGSGLSSGIYFFNLIAGNERKTIKMIFNK
ncbi:MAG: Ig-like domain-containing protein [Ignavibacteria bacterium]|nr:Ig-like domain-containing protein [Ignavibacteria bacterium]